MRHIGHNQHYHIRRDYIFRFQSLFSPTPDYCTNSASKQAPLGPCHVRLRFVFPGAVLASATWLEGLG